MNNCHAKRPKNLQVIVKKNKKNVLLNKNSKGSIPFFYETNLNQ